MNKGKLKETQVQQRKKPLRYLSLFSGVGAFEMALNNIDIDYELVNYCEIDKHASKSYSAIHNVSEILNLWDITKIDIDNLPQDIDLITHGSPCFTGETLVLTDKGYIQIKDIKIGSKVLSHDNKYHNVSNFLEQGEKEIWEIKAKGLDIIRTTENHKFWVRKKVRLWDNNEKRYKRILLEPEWLECNKLTKDYFMGYAINQESKIPKWFGVESNGNNHTHMINNLNMESKDLWYLAGRYIGDGWIRKRKERNSKYSSVIICCGKHKTDVFEKNIVKIHYTKTEDATTYKYQFSSKELAHFLKSFGMGAKNKVIPGFVFSLPRELIKELLRGYFDSDGCKIGNVTKASSISRELIYGIEQLIAKSENKATSIFFNDVPKTCKIENRTVNQNSYWSIQFANGKKEESVCENGYIWNPIRTVTNTTKKEEVFDITVDDSHSFTANGVIAHNCQDFSVAGIGKGGNKDSGTRSSLMWNTVEIVKHCKPQFVLWENVKGVLSAKNVHNFEKYLDELEKLGYESFYKILNAKDYGIPQNRERIFVVSILGKENNYIFPDAVPLELSVMDLLEDEVNERYYIGKDKVEKLLSQVFKKDGIGIKQATKQGYAFCKNNGVFNCSYPESDTRRGRVIAGGDIAGTIECSNQIGKVEIKKTDNIQLLGHLERPSGKTHQSSAVYSALGCSPTIVALEHKCVTKMCIPILTPDRLEKRQNGRRAKENNDPMFTITAQDKHGVIIDNDNKVFIRKLTPRECWRLFGFMDEDFNAAEQAGISNSQLYKQAGNSIVVTCLEGIFTNLLKQK